MSNVYGQKCLSLNNCCQYQQKHPEGLVRSMTTAQTNQPHGCLRKAKLVLFLRGQLCICAIQIAFLSRSSILSPPDLSSSLPAGPPSLPPPHRRSHQPFHYDHDDCYHEVFDTLTMLMKIAFILMNDDDVLCVRCQSCVVQMGNQQELRQPCLPIARR